jgi:malate dehydrogenase (oxaloacetate-decarboxylating)(NADP+)
MIRQMARFPIVFSLATPVPEIGYDEARASRRDAVVATALTQHPNAIVDLLSVPFVLRGALDVQATRITDGMLLAAARSLAGLAREEVADEVSRAYGRERFSFGPEYLLPKPVDPRIFVRESAAVARQALVDGVARRPIEPGRHDEALRARLGTGGELMRRLILKARREQLRVVFPEGRSETVLRAAAILADEGIARPILLGAEAEVRAAIDRLGLDLSGISVMDPARPSARRLRRTVFPHAAPARRDAGDGRRTPRAARLLRRDDAERRRRGHDDFGIRGALRGLAAHDPRSDWDGPGGAPGVEPLPGPAAARGLFPGRLWRQHRTDRRWARGNRAPHRRLRPRAGSGAACGHAVLLNFGSVDHALAKKVRLATEMVKTQAPSLFVDGEMQLATALNADIRRDASFCDIQQNANVLIFPDLQSGNLAMQLLQRMGEAVVVGPVLMDAAARAPDSCGSTVQDLVNLTALGLSTRPPRAQNARRRAGAA